MTIGIYCLNFHDLIYIGKSNKLERRFKDHLYNLKNGLSNYKMLEAYAKYGEPIFTVLEYCKVSELSSKECLWIAEFNSVEDGLNITSGGDGGGSGVQHNRAIHTKDILLSVLDYLSSTSPVHTYEDIFEYTGVSISTITNIVEGSAHTWLSEAHPDKYSIISTKELKSIRSKISREIVYSSLRGKSKDSFLYPSIQSPEGTIYENITNAKAFAELHNLSPEGLCRLFSGKIKTHRHWKLT